MRYVALLRGIGPGNPNMRNDKLRGFFESLGFANVQSVISSGNIIFESKETDAKKLEARIETALPKQLGFTSTTIIRNQTQLERLVAQDYFKDLIHDPSSYLMVTFLKTPAKVMKTPYRPAGKPYKFIAAGSTEICSVTDNTVLKTTDLMTWLEKEYGKQISSRTYKTVQRILSKLQQPS